METLRRKALESMETWYRFRSKQALLVTGARQVGKTFLIREFARNHWEHVAEFNFYENIRARDAVSAATNTRDLFMRLSVFADQPLVPGKTVLFLDEIQECDNVLTAIKFLMERKDFDYILSGSLLGVVLKGILSAPVGYLSTVKMYPLDFEEYCWANGIGADVLSEVKRCCAARVPVDEYVHERLLDLFHRYLICGGMPDPLQAFLETDSIPAVRVRQEAIVGQYQWDITKYAGKRARAVRRIFELIPSEIGRQDKRFVVRDVDGDSHFDRYDNDFMWLTDANVALPTYNVTEPRYPLKTNLEATRFKLFSSDVGILTYQCGMDIVRDMIAGRHDINYGALYENAVAQELAAHGHDLMYFKNRALGELDFVIQAGERVVPIEVKSGKSYTRHSALNKVLNVGNYGIEHAVVLHEGNVETKGSVSYLPIYMAMCL